jgi:hypothetical protein
MPYTGKDNHPPAYRGADGLQHDDWVYDAKTDQWYIPKSDGGMGVPAASFNAPLPGSQPGAAFSTPSVAGARPSTPMPYSSYASGGDSLPASGGSGGGIDWGKILSNVGSFVGDHAGDILKTGGAIAEGYMSSADRAKALAEQQAEFQQNLNERKAEYGRTTGDAEAQQAVQDQAALNKAPIADKAQALILARMGHPSTTFQPRDYTKGLSQLNGQATGGPQDAMAAARSAAASYTPGSGGVDTSALEATLAKLRGSSGIAPQAPPATPPVGGRTTGWVRLPPLTR